MTVEAGVETPIPASIDIQQVWLVLDADDLKETGRLDTERNCVLLTAQQWSFKRGRLLVKGAAGKKRRIAVAYHKQQPAPAITENKPLAKPLAVAEFDPNESVAAAWPLLPSNSR
jgi:hypothetical protein